MPRQPKRPCNKVGCPNLTHNRYCPDHMDEATQYDRDRGSAASRGYDGRWRKARKAHLAEEPLCRECLTVGRTTAASDVDHVKPVGGADDPLFWDETNWQSLCSSHHKAKSARERVR